MADNSANIYPYPYQFDPSQWSNKYSPYQGKALPWPTQYSGVPTDALGNPIPSYLQAMQAAASQPAPAMPPSTTLNSTPQQMQYTATPRGDVSGSGRGVYQGLDVQATPVQPQQAPPAAPSSSGGGSPVDMSAAYLNALANPGKVTTPGANVPQAPTPTGQSGVLQQFLQNWQNRGSPTTGAGNYNNAAFFNALQGQV